MSLNSHLNDSRSAVYGFMREQFPNSKSFVRTANKEMKGAATIRPEGQVDWGTIGMAIDYRLRYCFGVAPKESLWAWHGANIIQRAVVYGTLEEFREMDPELSVALFENTEAVKGMIPGFFSDLEETLSRLRPERRRLGKDDEELLA